MNLRTNLTLLTLLIGCGGKLEPGADPDSGIDTMQSPPDASVNHALDAGVGGPKGVWVAFDSRVGNGNRDIWMVRADGTGLQQLTNDAFVDREPAFSPDGQQIAFTSDRSGDDQIWVLDTNTKAAHQLTQHQPGADQSAWSPDGTLIAFHEFKGPGVFTIHVDGTAEAHVANGLDWFNAYFHPAFVDDSNILVDRNNEIDWLYNGKVKSQPVRNWTTQIMNPTVSLDSAKVACDISCGLGHSIWIVPANASATPCKDGFELATAGANPSWGAGDLIAFESGGGRDAGDVNTDIAIVAAAGGAPFDLTSSHGGVNLNPSVSPVAFAHP